MVKKRIRDAEVSAKHPSKQKQEEEQLSGSEEDFQTLSIEFECFNFVPLDFHGVKTLLRQLFDVDAQLHDLSTLSDAVIEQNTIGSTVKAEEQEGDAFAFLSVLGLGGRDGVGKEKGKVVREVGEWILRRCKDVGNGKGKGKGKGLEILEGVLKENMKEGDEGKKQVGLLLSERLINCPSEIAPPMCTCLIDEIEAAVEDGEPYNFSHYLILSRVYIEIESRVDREEEEPRNKKSKGGKTGEEEICYFHQEDEVFRRFGSAECIFEWERDGGEGVADSKRAFQEMGVRTLGLVVLLERRGFEDAVGVMNGNSGDGGDV